MQSNCKAKAFSPTYFEHSKHTKSIQLVHLLICCASRNPRQFKWKFMLKNLVEIRPNIYRLLRSIFYARNCFCFKFWMKMLQIFKVCGIFVHSFHIIHNILTWDYSHWNYWEFSLIYWFRGFWNLFEKNLNGWPTLKCPNPPKFGSLGSFCQLTEI